MLAYGLRWFDGAELGLQRKEQKMDNLAIDELIEAFSKNDLWDLAGALQTTKNLPKR